MDELRNYTDRHQKLLLNDTQHYNMMSLLQNNQSNPFILYVNKKGGNCFNRNLYHNSNLTPYQKLHEKSNRMKKLLDVKKYINSDSNNIFRVNSLLSESSLTNAASASNIHKRINSHSNNNKILKQRVNSTVFISKYKSRPLTGVKLKAKKKIKSKNGIPIIMNVSNVKNDFSYPHTDRARNPKDKLKLLFNRTTTNNNLTNTSENNNNIYNNNSFATLKTKQLKYSKSRVIKLRQIIFNTEINI